MMRAASGRPGGVQADVWSRGTQQAPPTPGGPLSGIQLHKTQNSFKVGLAWPLMIGDLTLGFEVGHPSKGAGPVWTVAGLLAGFVL
jgi:hypothetical protein